ncbi:MAG: acyl-[acyl-carrier-protein]--UDP-N-acetylglucosamine O-acyltransferase, partial [Gammaproteobacteria bacterium]|nr:acyl-[acyl-carrier-protein]--UDP-N-acetylglucosamine O-acyltransferase [Gammaproteobacteria bacterium]
FLVHSSLAEKDILPYVIASTQDKSTASIRGLNARGLKRNGFSMEAIEGLRRAYKVFFMQNLPLEEAMSKLKEMISECPEIQAWVDFIESSKRGVVR